MFNKQMKKKMLQQIDVAKEQVQAAQVKVSQAALKPDEQALFSDSMKGIKPLAQDTIRKTKIRANKPKTQANDSIRQESAQREHFFSDQFEPHIADEGPTRYIREGVSPYELKKLRRGDYEPELLLDLHGLTQEIAKVEISALIAECRKQHIRCCNVMHGHGKNILKRQLPMWLAQHPDIEAFHQATKTWGGSAAISILVELTTKEDMF
ncbi:endonuclease SmrB [Moritella sp. Urea-trap-13]|uniref:endonuclease SmrB n=1 Tax=Moritella sp. Urea-trap-13 TaxID=2058327 RepID=UPI000C3277D1|nr:endonuclease SmrB [Moritella sp. Urea-trap-13]PKH07709.1 endonuclease SmrB [Moritella sp. Urea-trap-13]